MGPSVALVDSPKCLREPALREARKALLHMPHMRELAAFVESLRRENPDAKIPDFDPLDGGIEAECLFVLEAPGPKARDSGFASRNNPDETAKNWLELNNEAKIHRSRTIIWNIVPWYIGDGKRIRPANTADIQRGLPYLQRLIAKLKSLRVVVLVGGNAQKAQPRIEKWTSNIAIHRVMHPSPLVFNRRPDNRHLILKGLEDVRRQLDGFSQADH
jgi:uracil-DNA glycosylase